MSKVALVTGNDTGVGKTRVAASLAVALASLGTVRYVKLVETGVVNGAESDAQKVEALAKGALDSKAVVRSYREPLAPVAAAAREGAKLCLHELIAEFQEARGSTWTIVEGAGGFAVPLDPSGADWRDFAMMVPVDAVIVVLENRLGAINQMRLLEPYCQPLSMPCGFWLNEARVQGMDTTYVNEEALCSAMIPTWARQRHGEEPTNLELSWASENTG